MLVEHPAAPQLGELLTRAFEAFAQVPGVQPDITGLHAFMIERLRGWLRDRGHPTADIDAVLAVDAEHLDLIAPRLQALATFRALPQASSLAAANKRIGNLLRKAPDTDMGHAVDIARLIEPTEQALHAAIEHIAPQVEQALAARDYTGALSALATLREPVDAFFEAVMVNADDPHLRRNRLALLAGLHRLMNRVADLSQLAG
jgi:glycyl-tRNA synthetase beta chain